MSYVWLAIAKKTSLLVTILVLFIALLASCSGGTEEGSKASNKEEASTSASKDRNEGENPDSSEEAASSSDPEDQDREAKASSEEVAVASGSENRDERGSEGSNNKVESPPPNYPDPPPQPNFTPGPLDEGYQWYHPDVDGDTVGSSFFGEPYLIGEQPPGWVIYNFVHWDNCPETNNPNQEDSDNDGWGDVCDPEPFIPYNPNQAK